MAKYTCEKCYDTGSIPVMESILPITTGRPCPYCEKGKDKEREQSKNNG